MAVKVEIPSPLREHTGGQTEVAVAGLKAYVEEVKNGRFPDDDHSYGVDDKEYEKFLNLVEKRRHA